MCTYNSGTTSDLTMKKKKEKKEESHEQCCSFVESCVVVGQQQAKRMEKSVSFSSCSGFILKTSKSSS